MDEELWAVLGRLDDFYVAEAGPLRAGKEAARHIVASHNVHYRRIRRFAGEALCSTQAGRRNGFRRVPDAVSCHGCIQVARRLTEVPPPDAAGLPAGYQQLNLFEPA